MAVCTVNPQSLMDAAATTSGKETAALQQLVDSLSSRLHEQAERYALLEARCRSLEVLLSGDVKPENVGGHGHEHEEKLAASTFVGGLRRICPDDVRGIGPTELVAENAALRDLVESLILESRDREGDTPQRQATAPEGDVPRTQVADSPPRSLPRADYDPTRLPWHTRPSTLSLDKEAASDSSGGAAVGGPRGFFVAVDVQIMARWLSGIEDRRTLLGGVGVLRMAPRNQVAVFETKTGKWIGTVMDAHVACRLGKLMEMGGTLNGGLIGPTRGCGFVLSAVLRGPEYYVRIVVLALQNSKVGVGSLFGATHRPGAMQADCTLDLLFRA